MHPKVHQMPQTGWAQIGPGDESNRGDKGVQFQLLKRRANPTFGLRFQQIGDIRRMKTMP